MITTALIFDESLHVYKTPEGKPLLGVTSILKMAGLIDTRFYNEESALRGTVIHALTELEDRGIQTQTEKHISGYLDAYRAFLRETGCSISSSECVVYHKEYGFAGRLDRCAQMTNLQGEPVIIDIKTGVPCRYWPIQLAGYALALEQNPWPKRYALQLQSNGKYRLIQYSDNPRDLGVFLAALRITRFLSEP